MIVLKRKEDCCGCGACESICPKSCISMREDDEGFLYPETDIAKCINCGAREKVCPVLNSKSAPETQEPKVFAVRCASDELRFKSASGGIFTLLAEDVLNVGGVVFGARWNDDFTEVFHDYTETLDGLAVFRGSKYLQSRIGDAYKKAHEFLLAGRKVLFTGTPCQVAGLRHFLRKDFPNLLAVDIACHSVPSPKVWRAFWADLQEREKISKPTDVRFRKKVFDEKCNSWNSAAFAVETLSGTAFEKPFYSTPFGIGFNSGLFALCVENALLRNWGGGYKSDITIGDFWGIEKYFPKLNSGEGVSVAVCHSERGFSTVDAVKPRCKIFQEVRYVQVTTDNGGFKIVLRKNPKREKFFGEFNATQTPKVAIEKIEKFVKPPFVQLRRQELRFDSPPSSIHPRNGKNHHPPMLKIEILRERLSQPLQPLNPIWNSSRTHGIVNA